MTSVGKTLLSVIESRFVNEPQRLNTSISRVIFVAAFGEKVRRDWVLHFGWGGGNAVNSQ